MSWFGKKKKKVNRSEGYGLPELPPISDGFSDSLKIKAMDSFKPKIFDKPEEEKLEQPPKFSLPSQQQTVLPIKNELPPLPAFPISRTGESMPREAVRNAISEDEEEEEDDGRVLTREISESYEPEFIQPKHEFMPEHYGSKRQTKEQIYVRIDKYQESLAEFNEIKRKLKEIEDLLAEIKEIKAKEEFELQEWEKEIRDAKTKLDRIDNTLFKQLED